MHGMSTTEAENDSETSCMMEFQKAHWDVYGYVHVCMLWWQWHTPYECHEHAS